jgi:excisionase family DNA binding protein
MEPTHKIVSHSEKTTQETAMGMQFDELMTVREIAEVLKVPVSWVYERTRIKGSARLPHIKMGKYLRFSPSQVKSWLEQFQQF